jgi:hypothetical protein
MRAPLALLRMVLLLALGLQVIQLAGRVPDLVLRTLSGERVQVVR